MATLGLEVSAVKKSIDNITDENSFNFATSLVTHYSTYILSIFSYNFIA